MSIHISILNECEQEDDVPDSAFIQQCCDIALQNNTQTSELSVAIVSLEKIRQLNFDYRQKDKPTNVLSFESVVPPELNEQRLMLGDIVLCPAVIRAEAHDQNKLLRAHWAHMLIHGMLHLQGYDHIEPDDADQMESLEVQLLAKLGYPDPYRSIDDNDEAVSH